MLEVDFQLVALDGGDGAVAELGVEDALAEAEVVAALVAEGDGAGLGLDRGTRISVICRARAPRLRSGRTEILG